MYYTERCEKKLCSLMEFDRVILTNSCTSALELSCMAIGLGDRDEVIMPSYTYSSTANCVV